MGRQRGRWRRTGGVGYRARPTAQVGLIQGLGLGRCCAAVVAATESDIPHVSPLYLPYISPTSPQVLLVAANESDVHGAVVRQVTLSLTA